MCVQIYDMVDVYVGYLFKGEIGFFEFIYVVLFEIS